MILNFQLVVQSYLGDPFTNKPLEYRGKVHLTGLTVLNTFIFVVLSLVIHMTVLTDYSSTPSSVPISLTLLGLTLLIDQGSISQT